MLTAAALALALAAFPLGPLASLPADMAVLSEGTIALRGLPFFAPNAIRALGGEYSLGSARIQVWFTRDAVAFSEAWKRTPLAGYVAYVQARKDAAAAKGTLYALALGPYALFVQVPEDGADARSFIAAFERRFAVFYANAKDDSELSFPAFVDLKAAK
jgi:hypothetical protein